MSTAKKFKVGDKVRVRAGLAKNKEHDGVYCNPDMANLGGRTLTIIDITPSRYSVEENVWTWNDAMLESISKTFDNLEAGDILIDNNDDEREVFAVLGELVAIHDGVNDGHKDFHWHHVDWLKSSGWTIKQDTAEDLTELSVAEIEERLGVPSGSLRVKKDAN